MIGLQTLMWHLMRRRVQDGKIDAVSMILTFRWFGRPNGAHVRNRRWRDIQMENARAALDLYRSHGAEWESAVSKGQWPCSLPPSQFSRCFT